MKRWLPRLRRAIQTQTPGVLMRKIVPRLGSELTALLGQKFFEWQEIRCRDRRSRLTDEHLRLDPTQVPVKQREDFRFLAAMILEHRFQLLGSDWCDRSHPQSSFDGLDPWLAANLRPAHRGYARKLCRGWSPDYRPLDWQREIRCSHRWDARVHYRSLTEAITPGADVKQAWELGRLQHIPRLALLAGMFPDQKTVLIKEFRDQILDFIAMNPPGMGIQWLSPLEVALRGGNLALAWLLLSPADKELSDVRGFRRILACSIRDHGRYLVKHLEYHPDANNHYLGNIAGLVFIASVLQADEETDRWLAFADQELARQIRRQFRQDGGNFEGSLSYHRFSGELAAFAVARLRGLATDRWQRLRDLVPDGRIARLLPASQRDTLQPGLESLIIGQRFQRAVEFTMAASDSRDRVAAYGDNDNGRFFTITPMFPGSSGVQEGTTPREVQHDHGPFLAAVEGLLSAERESLAVSQRFPLEFLLTRTLSRGHGIPDPDRMTETALSFRTIWELHFPGPEKPLDHNGQWRIFPRSGLIAYRSSRMHMTVSALPNGTDGVNNHSHNDKLSFTLEVDGEALLRDPGTGGYTGDPDLRNSLRSTRAHSAPWHGEEQNRFGTDRAGLFHAYDDAEVEIVDSAPILILRLISRRLIHLRSIHIMADRIRIEDRATHPFIYRGIPPVHSPGYGELEPASDALASRVVLVEDHEHKDLDHSH